MRLGICCSNAVRVYKSELRSQTHPAVFVVHHDTYLCIAQSSAGQHLRSQFHGEVTIDQRPFNRGAWLDPPIASHAD